MGTGMTLEEARELLAAYALGAVSAEEAESIEWHLLENVELRREFAGFAGVAGALEASYPELAPHVWESIAGQLTETPPPMRPLGEAERPVASVRSLDVERTERSGGARVRRRLVAAAIAAAAVIVGGLVGVSIGRSSDTPTLTEVASAAADQPGARSIALRSSDGSGELSVVLAKGGTGYVTGTTLEPLDDAQTYQLWAIGPQGPISLGVLGNDPGVSQFAVARGATALALSVEPATGSVQPNLPPVASATI